ncbi:MAG: helix-turn-helix domain-containing protein [Nitrososphaeraceae archaeon]|nr:helix-turn-helix domain-containing protein [Nitrososphaeraceae archaeon]
MERVQYQTSNRTSSKRGGILESASRRVRMIFSVMASPNRIDILRILNSKGPLTYSELKSLAGFKSKKESGKFAYHLRKLLRQSLVSLNKAERRYTITNLGKLVLSLARQIEERSIIESGKLYVRTTKPSIEEFDSNKIIQSLVREANMPLELANKITEEVENKIYKIQTSYLTSSLIRETTNSVLVEHGYDEYRNKLARLGLPPIDLINIMEEMNFSHIEIPDLFMKTSSSIFTEYLLNNILPKDIVDMHLMGEINIGNSGFWNLLPDTIFANINSLIKNITEIKGKYLGTSRLNVLYEQTSDASIILLLSLLSREVSREIVLEGLPKYLEKNLTSDNSLENRVYKLLFLSSSISTFGTSSPFITFPIIIEEIDSHIIDGILSGYKRYVENTPIPNIGLSITYNNKNKIYQYIDQASKISRLGGIISFSQNKIRGRYGLAKSFSTNDSPMITLQSLSINLPRIAYQSNNDETYFRAKLALLLKPLLSIIIQRKNIISNSIQKGNIPLISKNTSNLETGQMFTLINLVGINESIYNILGYNVGKEGNNILCKVIQTASDIIKEQTKGIPDSRIGVTILKDESSTRFKNLDDEKYGKSVTISDNHANIEGENYSEGFQIKGTDIISNNFSMDLLLDHYSTVADILQGNLSIDLDINDITSENDVTKVIEFSLNFPFVHLRSTLSLCTTCGARSEKAEMKICQSCGSQKISILYT